jgi:hypothetical protein
LVILPRLINRKAFHIKIATTSIRLNEKIIIKRDATTDTIKRAKYDMGNPHIKAPLRMLR